MCGILKINIDSDALIKARALATARGVEAE
jgi:hypothetical protein